MLALLDWPPHPLAIVAALVGPMELVLVFACGLIAGAVVNWAVYALAWNRRFISPWSPVPAGAPARRGLDRLPVVGWLGLRREASVHGRGFWKRPAAVELLMGLGWAALYWWEVDRQGLLAQQAAALGAGLPAPGQPLAPYWTTISTFASHAILIGLMTAASLIDIDEKTIPDGVTVPGTLLALVVATVAPMALLPQIAVHAAPPLAGVELVAPPHVALEGGVRLYVEPVTPAAPNPFPHELSSAPRGLGLLVGLACYATWMFALTPRVWRGRRGIAYGLRVLLARVAREMARPPLLWLGLAGAAAIVAVWFRGGASWLGLLTSLAGIVGASALVWAVRICSSAALRREALGFGDVTLMMMVGAFLGWQAGVFIFFLAPFAALAVGAVQLALRRSDEIFYGPFLYLATIVVIVRWASFWNAGPSLQQLFFWPWLVPIVLVIGVALMWAMLVMWRNLKEAIFRH